MTHYFIVRSCGCGGHIVAIFPEEQRVEAVKCLLDYQKNMISAYIRSGEWSGGHLPATTDLEPFVFMV
jgi:hypothetical protein